MSTPATTNYFARGQSSQPQGTRKPGYQQLVYAAPLSFFDTIAVPDGAMGVDAKTITTDHAFLTDKGFIPLYSVAHTPAAPSDSPGDEGALNQNWAGTFFIPGDDAKTQQLVETLQNDDLIILFTDPSDGSVRQFGSASLPAHISKVAFSSGTTKPDDKKGWLFNFDTMDRFFYGGTITLLP